MRARANQSIAGGAVRVATKDRNYLAPPASGKLAELDPALIVTPPPGMEVGYVPIVTRQAPRE